MLDDLKSCTSRSGLAVLLGVKPSELSYTLYKIPDAAKYTSFCISKKSGGTRQIQAPCPPLKWLQGRLLDLLYQCEDDISAASGLKRNLHSGFRRGVNIYENANAHRGKRFVFNIDIESFFDQYNFGRVRAFFINDRDFALQPAVATTIAQIVCFNNVLPQGSPTSPHIANLLTQFFDNRMARFLRPRRCGYTRYADDITISTNVREFPADVAIMTPADPQGWSIAPELAAIFGRANLPPNPSKTRMSAYSSRQTVTGLVVNQRPNVTREYYLHTRAMCDRLFKTGTIQIPDITSSYGKNCPVSDDAEPEADVDPLKVLEGRLSHIHHIREKSDLRNIQEKQDNPTQFWNMLQDFFLFKYFVANSKPLILTEGPSDIFYLRSAIINNTTLLVPELKKVVSGKPEILPTFFRFNTVAAKVIGLTGGAGNIKRFLYLYHKQEKRFNRSLRHKPVIIIIDNDSGGADVINMVNGIYKTNISLSDPIMAHKITDGLILVKTPHVGSKTHTAIEDLLPASVKAVKLNGKSFSAAKKFDATKHFGKIALGSYVQANASSISFQGFDDFIVAINGAITM
ncbi:RNA-directed DNA polymerase (plasmid) [Sphingomonas sp. AP4-R1]|uniref:retron Ec67 family RNA-directed DNA polymerase/endonuclease n=1 Tax=Sphingomonas sp. AP4-R1 TaxID=2735134 RepID=UPI0014939F12|nr:retron Ec67 family RNA-directed DNA polymerase/endonuclease [Sphingomonas sp. AP4-R1]QJU60965.1 RNA-directed DNA polymerase [Sphingomonas sp. AP4-R1]